MPGRPNDIARRGAGRRPLATGRPAGAALAALALLAACTSPRVRVAARGVLPYALATEGAAVVTVELAERFELVVRDGAAERRLDLGPPEIDLRALAVHGTTAFVGSDTGFVREIDLARLRVVRELPLGAPLRALAADATYLLSADASGAVCLRRRRDGALLQCARSAVEVAGLTLEAERAWLTPPSSPGAAPAVARAWALPSLTPLPAPTGPTLGPAPLRWRGGEVHAEARRVMWRRGDQQHVVLELATAVRHLAVTRAGTLVATAWPRTLQDAVVVMVSP